MRYQVGQTIDGRYEIVSALGEGGMNETYHARDCETQGDVVVKIPFAGIIGDPATFSRYQREMEIGERLRHPNIQRLLGRSLGGSGRPPYLVLEYVDGELLRGYLDRKAPLPLDEAVGLVIQLADALEYCHAQGVVHRDLKPENLLLQPDGQLKLVDFGIALLRGARRVTFRRLSNEVGTPDYMAPEQVQGERGDARTDVYAVGVMLYEMLTGSVPFQGDNALAVMSQRVTGRAPLLRQARPDLPPWIEAVVYKALRRQPSDRYQSMAQLRHDLEHPDEVPIPVYEPAEVRIVDGPVTLWRSVLLILAVFALLAALGVAAQLLHQAQVPR